MIAGAKARHIRISPRKVRSVIALVKGKPTKAALTILENTHKRAAGVVNKLLRSALANAKNKGIDEEGLFIAKVFADEGPTWKRFQANAFGRGARILKRTCHITLELDQKIVSPKAVATPKKTRVQKKESRTKKKK